MDRLVTDPEEAASFVKDTNVDALAVAVNAARASWWEPPVKRYIDDCLAGQNGPRGRDFNMRWIGSMG